MGQSRTLGSFFWGPCWCCWVSCKIHFCQPKHLASPALVWSMLARNQYKVWLRRRTGSIRAASHDLDLHSYSFGIERGRKEMIWNDDDDEFSMYLCLFLFFSELVTPLFGDWRAVWSSWSMNDLPHIRSRQKKKFIQSANRIDWFLSVHHHHHHRHPCACLSSAWLPDLSPTEN